MSKTYWHWNHEGQPELRRPQSLDRLTCAACIAGSLRPSISSSDARHSQENVHGSGRRRRDFPAFLDTRERCIVVCRERYVNHRPPAVAQSYSPEMLGGAARFCFH